MGCAPGHYLPSLDRDINIGRINVEAAKAATTALRCDESCAGAQERIQHKIAALRHILDRVGNQSSRLDRRVKIEIPRAGCRQTN